jgi:hypothetical protein
LGGLAGAVSQLPGVVVKLHIRGGLKLVVRLVLNIKTFLRKIARMRLL